MGGLLLIGLLVELCVLLAKLWPVLVTWLVLYLVWHSVIAPSREVRAREARDRLRHERARQEIDRIAIETSRAMYEAAVQGDTDVIDGHAVEIR